jgi:membrane-bound lytic murein transglycosylase B
MGLGASLVTAPPARAQTASPALVTPAEPAASRPGPSATPTAPSTAAPPTAVQPATPAVAPPKPKASAKATTSRTRPATRSRAATAASASTGLDDDLAPLPPCRHPADITPYDQRPAVRAWAERWAATHPNQPAQDLLRQLGRACYQADVTRLIMPTPPGQTRNWAAYQARFIEPRRIQAGLEFWRREERWLAAAELRYGVPAEVIVGIVGVETLYGQQTGRYRVLDALATLAFDFPTGRSDRSAFFQDQLGALLQLARQEGLDPAGIRGSYAGAIGWGQFMPGSWLTHAVDFNGDSRIDLQASVPDVIGSIANFLANHGWQPGLPARFGVQPPEDADQLAALLAPDIRPSFTRHELEDSGAQLDEAGREHNGLLALVELQNGDDAAPSYVAGSENFWALTRYNWSAYYAMAVLDLGEAIAARRAGLVSDEAASRPATSKPSRAAKPRRRSTP